MKHENAFKRGKIVDENANGNFAVYLVDYGKVVDVNREDLYTCEGIDERSRLKSLQLVYELPPQCIACRLSEVVPSPIMCASGWSDKSTEAFMDFIEGKGLEIVVNSFVDRIASVRLVAGPRTQNMSESVNEQLVIWGFAQTSDDSYMNQLDNLKRENQRSRSGHENERKKVEDEYCDVGVTPPPEESLCESANLDGPVTLLESRPKMMSRVKCFDVVVDASSVNQVLIDPFPNDFTKKVLVAASMTQKENRVTLRETTIMPHLPGMMCLLGLIFSPTAEVHLTPKKDRYSSILFGLGADENQKPHFGEHDLLVNVDVELTHADFTLINQLRNKISVLLRNVPGFKFQPKVNNVNKTELRKEISKLLMKISLKHRSPLGIIAPDKSDWNWKPFVKSEDDYESMYPRLESIERLKPISDSTRRAKLKHADELERLGRINTQDRVVECRLCEERIETVVDLQLHVGKKLHKERLVRIRDETSEAH